MLSSSMGQVILITSSAAVLEIHHLLWLSAIREAAIKYVQYIDGLLGRT
jgi:hypothetical protein